MFNLLGKHPDMKCHVSDLNADLILAYLAIRDKVTEVIESLEDHAKRSQNLYRKIPNLMTAKFGLLQIDSIYSQCLGLCIFPVER